MTGCQSSDTVALSSQPSVQSSEPAPQSNDKISVYKMKDGTRGSDAEPMPGAVKMTFPPYKVKLATSEYYLWINEKKNGSIVNLDNTHTMYTLSKSATYKLREILSYTG